VRLTITETLARHRPVIFLSTHVPEVHRAALAFPREPAHRVAPIPGGDVEGATEAPATPGS
jgi:hypothetical protein